MTGSGSFLIATNVASANGIYVGSSGSYNSLTVRSGGAVRCYGGWVGNGAATGNTVLVSGGSWTNTTGSLNIGLGGAYSNSMTIDNGGVVSVGGIIGIGSGSASISNTLTILNGTVTSSSSLNVGDNASANGNNVMVNGTSSLLRITGYDLTVGQNGNRNSLVVTNGGRVICARTIGFGGTPATGNTGTGINNLGLVTGSGSQLIATNSGTGYGIIVGYSNSYSTLTIRDGALASSYKTYVGYVANATSNTILVSNGGFLEGNSLIVGTGTGNRIDNNGGIYQFTQASPAITPAGFGNITLTNGTVSFRGITDAEVFCNQGTKSLDSTNKMAWAGTNAFRLDNATNNSTGQAYNFHTGTATNFARLELLNGSLYRGGNVAIGPGGTLYVSGGVNTISTNLTIDSTATFSVDLSSTNGYGTLVVQKDLNLNSCALNVNLGSAPVPGSSFMIVSNSAGATSGSFATRSQVVTVNNTNYIVRVNTSASGATVTCNLQTRGLCIIID